MNWLYYLLEANLYLVIFYGFYYLMLRKETFYVHNRYYLISVTILAFVLPLLQIGYLNSFFTKLETTEMTLETKLTHKQTNFDLILSYSNTALKFAYIGVAVVLCINFIKGLYNILSLIWKAKKQKMGNIVQIEINDPQVAFSFFNYLFLNPNAKEQETILKHELVHIRQKHSLDVILFELISITNWFNPISWLLKKDIQLLHEYIADEQTTAFTLKKHEYAMFLIQNSFGQLPNPLSNQLFNQSILKMRINMLNKEKSAGRARLRFLLAVPIAAAMVCSSSMALTKDYAKIDLYSFKGQKVSGPTQDTLKKKASTKKSSEKLAPPPPPAPPKELPKGVKYPPPIVKPDAPAPKKTAPKSKVVKFPPPIVTPNAPKKGKAIPAPKVETIKFPPPKVKKDKLISVEAPPPPPVEPK